MIKKIWIYIFLGLFLFFLFMELAPMIEIHAHIPDVMLIFVVFIAQRYGVLSGILAGFFVGLLIDFFSGQLLGAQAFSKMTIGLMAGFIGNRLIVYSFQAGFLVTFLLMCVQSLIFYLEILIFSRLSSFEYFKGVWIDILYTTLVSPIFIVIFSGIDNKISKRA